MVSLRLSVVEHQRASMAIRKTHVKSAKRQAREKEQAAARAAASASGKFKDKKRKPDVQTGFRVGLHCVA